MTLELSRRRALKRTGLLAALSGAAVAIPNSWKRPVINAVFLPTHAQTSGQPPICADAVFTQGDFLLSVTIYQYRQGDNPSPTNTIGPIPAGFVGWNSRIEVLLINGQGCSLSDPEFSAAWRISSNLFPSLVDITNDANLINGFIFDEELNCAVSGPCNINGNLFTLLRNEVDVIRNGVVVATLDVERAIVMMAPFGPLPFNNISGWARSIQVTVTSPGGTAISGQTNVTILP